MEAPRNGSMQSTNAKGYVLAPHGINQSTFASRLQALYSHWRQHKDELWGSADIFVVSTPPPAENIGYLKSSKLNKWLLGYESPDTITFFGYKEIHFFCLQKDRLLETVVKATVDVDVIIHSKRKGAAGTSEMENVLHSLCKSNSEGLDGPIVGYMVKESPEGSLLEKWEDNLKRCGLQISDVTDGLSDFLAIMEPDEVTYENAGRLASGDSSADDYEGNSTTLNELIAYSGPKLVLAKNNFKPIRLSCVYIYPPFVRPQCMKAGVLEAHANGFRYSGRDEQVDIMYANIKHAFFQPEEMMVMITLIHFHLHDRIMVGDKKTKDVQFVTEEMRVLKTLGAKEVWNFDEDEIIERGRNECKMGFQIFVRRVNELWLQLQFRELDLKFEQPLQEFGFEGRVEPNKALAFIIPTSTCLVELVFTPFLVIPLSEIEIVNLERVGFYKQTDFDMAIVFKDFKRDVMRIDAIPSGSYGYIKGWLESTTVQYFESRVNIRWHAILKTFIDDPEAFIDVGGWDFLNREKEIFIEDGGGFVFLDLAATEPWPGCHDLYDDYIDDSEDDTEGHESSEASDAYPMLDFEFDDDSDTSLMGKKVEECLDVKEGNKTWEESDREARENADSKEKRRMKKAFGKERAGSAPKWLLTKKGAFGKMWVGPGFGFPKRRRIKKVSFGKGRAGAGSTAPKRLKFISGAVCGPHLLDT